MHREREAKREMEKERERWKEREREKISLRGNSLISLFLS